MFLLCFCFFLNSLSIFIWRVHFIWNDWKTKRNIYYLKKIGIDDWFECISHDCTIYAQSKLYKIAADLSSRSQQSIKFDLTWLWIKWTNKEVNIFFRNCLLFKKKNNNNFCHGRLPVLQMPTSWRDYKNSGRGWLTYTCHSSTVHF